MPIDTSSKVPVIQGVRYFLAHTPGMVRHGSKPSRDLLADPGLSTHLASHLRSFSEAAAYLPNRAFLGGIYPDELLKTPRPWYGMNGESPRWNPHGEIMPEEEFYGLLKIADAFDLVWLNEDFTRDVSAALADHPLVSADDLEKLGMGHPHATIEDMLAQSAERLPLQLLDGRTIGCVIGAHDQDATLTPDVLLENLACKVSAAMALRTLMSQLGTDPNEIPYVINCGEEAVGERYQRGGGNLAKGIAEMCGCTQATGSDVKAFCCGPVHAIVMASALVNSGIFKQVAVVAGCSLAKLGMKFQAHLDNDQPVLEDVLAAMAILISEDDGVSPKLRLDSVGRHTVGAGSSQQAIMKCLVSEPLERLGLRFGDVDKYATELHNPEVTEPGGSGDVPLLNYRMIAAMATLSKEINQADIPAFVERHGMLGFSPTQGHIASAIPFMAHAVDRMISGDMQRAMFLAKGSLFLGRMTRLSDGMSFILEKND
ncbi:MAG TPA: glycine reductase [Dehalococcoidia bacterium]|nr:glycine reductase [Dehalococcoidia bacterium]